MKAMLLAAGAGTRLRPLTYRLPKVMVPIANRPVLEYLIRHLAHQGFTDIAINLHHLPEPTVEYFGDGRRWGVSIQYSHEGEKVLGTAGGVKRVQSFLEDDIFIVLGGDDLTTVDLRAFAEAHRARKALASVVVMHTPDPSPYGLVEWNAEGRITGFVEKPTDYPAAGGWVSAGIYCFHPRIFADIPESEVYDFARQVFPTVLERGDPFYVFPGQGYWRDIGHLEDYLLANQEVMAGVDGLALPGTRVNGVLVEPGAQTEGGVLEGRTLIGEGATVAPGARLRDCVIGARCRIGRDVVLEDCVVWPDTEIPAGAHYQRAIVLPDEVVSVPPSSNGEQH